MTKKYFGTDGIRGKTGSALSPDFALKLGWALGQVLRQSQHQEAPRAQVLIGKDTRISGYMFESALEAGLAAAGVDSLLTGPLPTPAVGYFCRTFRCDAGVMISASHNGHEDNGFKFFTPSGGKFSDDLESRIEYWLGQELCCQPSEHLGKAARLAAAAERYVEYCKSTTPPEANLEGLKLAVDCAHGALYQIAPAVFGELGAEVAVIGADPDGLNINHGFGVLHPERLQQAVQDQGADYGVSFDGDGDRLLLVDSAGKVLDGDDILHCLASHWLQQGTWHGGVVGTEMTNCGLARGLQDLGIPFCRSAVGDRHIAACLEERKWRLGGEPNGHILFRDSKKNGAGSSDGIIAALQVLGALVSQETEGHFYKRSWDRFPQIQVNLRYDPRERPAGIDTHPELLSILEAVRRDLGDPCQAILRKSGTEPVFRVVVGGRCERLVKDAADSIVAKVRELLGHP